MTEHRSLARKKSFLAAYASVGAGPATTFCMVRDLSGEGARLEVADPAQLPETFDLQINGRNRLFHAKVTWRSDTEAGVRFLDSRPAARPDLARAS